MEDIGNYFCSHQWCWYLWAPLLIWCVFWLLIKIGKRRSVITSIAQWLPLALLVFYLFHGLSTSGLSTGEQIILGFYTFAIGVIEYLIEENKKTFSRTVFYDQYRKIEDQWKNIQQEGKSISQKETFLKTSLSAVENSITGEEVINNEIIIDKKSIDSFAACTGNIEASYFWMCCSKQEFFKEIFVFLYSDLLINFYKLVLSSFQTDPMGNNSKGEFPEFVSHELTQTLLSREDFKSQFNTSLTNIADFARDNCGDNLNIPKANLKLRRIIITDDILNNKYDQKEMNKICNWHNTNNVELKFISEKDARTIQNSNNYSGQLDFSLIEVGQSKVLLEAAKVQTSKHFGGRDHDMFNLSFATTTEQVDKASSLYERLWEYAKPPSTLKNI